MVGFLPPISSWIRSDRLDASVCNHRPTSQEPGNEMAFNGGAPTRALPSSPPEPATKFTTPFGKPASWHPSPIRHELRGPAEPGFTTMVLAQISAGASFQLG